MRFVHLSDLHFNYKGDGRESREIREELIEYLKESKIEADELLITGDFRHAKYQGTDLGEIKNVVEYIKLIAETIGINDVEHIHIVPGNHDRKRIDARQMQGIMKRYSVASGLFDSDDLVEIKSFFEYFYLVSDELYGPDNFWHQAELHTYRVSNNTVFLYLNTALTHNSDTSRGKLLIGNDCLDRLLREIDHKYPDFPIFILAHHSPDCFSNEERKVIENIISKHPKVSMYLCGDAHQQWIRRIDWHMEITMGSLRQEPGAEETFLYGDTVAQQYTAHHWQGAWQPCAKANKKLKRFFSPVLPEVAYEKSKLWQRVMNGNGEYADERRFLRDEYAKAHSNALLLVDEINRNPDSYIDHMACITDSLWRLVDVFLPEDYDINPAEVYILGLTSLIHEIGIDLVAWSYDIEDIHKETTWKDMVAFLCKERQLPYDFSNVENIDIGIQEKATLFTIRSLYAKKAVSIAENTWNLNSNSGNQQISIINNQQLKKEFGRIIGRIEESHGHTIEEIGEALSDKNPAASITPPIWTIDPLKLACIIRMADLINTNDLQGLYSYRAVRFPEMNSDLLMTVQDKLRPVQMKDNRIELTSTTPFIVNEREAWWACYDILKCIDINIRKIDSLLIEKGRKSFDCIGVHSIVDIAKKIEAESWQPIDTRIRATNVAHLVKTLGGQFLYGQNKLVPLRELIQNASDAIRARRYMEKSGNYQGTIVVTIGKEGRDDYIEVEDDGIGMSPDTLVGTLLDFGNSFWKSDKMHIEFPGLEQTAFKSTGQFGIGFFSVFMWGEKVLVSSKRYNKAYEDTRILEFEAGVEKRPFLRPATENEYVNAGGTKIRIYLSKERIKSIFIDPNAIDLKPLEMRIMECIQRLCPCLDCNLDIIINGTRHCIEKANDWITIDSEEFLRRVYGDWYVNQLDQKSKQYCCNSLKTMYDGNTCIGRACLAVGGNNALSINTWQCNIIDGGIVVKRVRNGIIGIITGHTNRASRDSAYPAIPQPVTDIWIQEQARLLTEYDILKSFHLSPFIVSLSHVNTCAKLARAGNDFLSYDEIVEKVKNEGREKYILFQNTDPTSQFYSNIAELYDNVLYIEEAPHFEDNRIGYGFDIYFSILDAVTAGWGLPSIGALVKHSRNEENVCIGLNTSGAPIEKDVHVLYKPDIAEHIKTLNEVIELTDTVINNVRIIPIDNERRWQLRQAITNISSIIQDTLLPDDHELIIKIQQQISTLKNLIQKTAK